MTADLDTLTQGCEWYIIAGDLNSKNSTWHSRCVIISGRTLYQHAQSADYTEVVPDSPTFYSRIPGHSPDVLDIAIVKLPQHLVDICNVNDLSSD